MLIMQLVNFSTFLLLETVDAKKPKEGLVVEAVMIGEIIFSSSLKFSFLIPILLFFRSSG